MKKLIYQLIFILISLLMMPFQSTAEMPLTFMLRWSPDGELLAVAKSNGLEIYDSTLSLVQTIHPNKFILSVDWHPSDTLLALTYEQGFEIWTRDDENQIIFSERVEISDTALAVFWNVDGSRLAVSNGADTRESPESQRLFPGHLATIMIWDTSNWQIIAETPDQYLIPDFQGIYELDWHPIDPQLFVVAGVQGLNDGKDIWYMTYPSAFIINSETGNTEYTINNVAKTQLYGVSWRPDGSCILVGDEPSVARLSISSGELIDGYITFNGRNLQWRSDGEYLFVEGGLFIKGNQDSLAWFPLNAIWHPTNVNMLTAIVDGVPVNYDLTDVSGYIPLNTPPAQDQTKPTPQPSH